MADEYEQVHVGECRGMRQLRADIERAQDGWRKERERAENALDRCTALEQERDDLHADWKVRHLMWIEDMLTEQRAHAETRAALEAAKAGQYEAQRLRQEDLDECEALAQAANAFREQLDSARADLERAQADADKSDQLSLEYLRERDEAIRAGNVTAALLSETRAAHEILAQQHAAVANERDSARADLAKLTEQWALDWLQHWQNTAPSDNLEMRLACRPVPAPVARLVRAGAGLPVGGCGCGAKVPTVEYEGPCQEMGLRVCAPGFGCSRREAER